MLTSASIFPVFCTCSLCGVGAFPTLCAFIHFKLSLLNSCLFVKLLYYCDHKLFWSVIWCHGVLSRDFCPSARRMYDGVFQILQNSSSLELAVASFHLLTELGKQYPRTYVADSGGHQSLVVVKESWVPFLFGNGAVSSEIGGNVRSSDHLFDPSRFSLLIEAIVEPTNGTDDNNGIKAIENMMLFQYLVNTLEADFVPRQIATKESLDWVIFRESLLSMLLV